MIAIQAVSILQPTIPVVAMLIVEMLIVEMLIVEILLHVMPTGVI
jgi:hypothetical protein